MDKIELPKINIAVLGPIGVGKTTFIKRLTESFRHGNYVTEVIDEPSVSILPVNQLLDKLYTDVRKWAYPLQAAISAAHEAQFEDIKGKKYDFAIFDMPYSSFMYCNIHCKNKRMSEKEKDAIVNLSRPFKFDFVITLAADEEEIVNHVKKRNNNCKSKTKEKADDLEIEDFAYLHEHIADFEQFKDAWIKKFFAKAKRYDIIIENDQDEAYSKQMQYIEDQILEKRSQYYIKKIKESL